MSPSRILAFTLLSAGCGGNYPAAPWPFQEPTDTTEEPARTPLVATAIDPGVVDPMGGSRVTITGSGFAWGSDHDAVDRVTIGGAPVTWFQVRTDGAIDVISPPVAAAEALEVVVGRGTMEATLAVDAWSPADLAGARVFDAATGVSVEEPATHYEWQRLTPVLHPDWRVRDGNTLTWMPTIGRFVAVAGWNGYDEPVGFSPVGAPPWPLQNTTDEVWSSADGVTWTNDLVHGNGAFERRHVHGASFWRDRLWVVGGDTHQGFYNHDVLSSPDGVTWTVELGPGTTEPPWPERALGMSGVYDGSLWMAGGQDLLGDPVDYAYHNDVWRTDDGVNWVQVAADAPASDTRWGGCGLVTGLVEFQGRMWLLGCAKYRDDAVGTSMSNEVWSTTDGLVWQRHADPPWAGKSWPDVVVWDDKLWILFGYTYGDPANGWPAGNSNEAWFSEDGETWRSLRPDAPVPGSHAQGVAVTDEAIVMAGGNHSYGIGLGEDKSVWRLVAFRGDAVGAWTDRGPDALVAAAAADDARPVVVPDAFGDGVPGVQFDGSTSVLSLPAPDEHPAGRSVFWVARAPYLPAPFAWEETYAPLGTIVGGPDGSGLPNSSVGLSDGQVALVNRNDALGAYGEVVCSRVAGGEGLQEGPGEARFAGLTHGDDGAVRVVVDGVVTEVGVADHGTPRTWSRLGGSLDDPYYGPNSRFAGTLGAVVVLPGAVDDATVERLHAWARGRFGVP